MGTIRQGALGGFSGKAGSIIGSSWREIHLIVNSAVNFSIPYNVG